MTIQTGDFVLADLSFTLESGEYALLMGRTGSGKTTVLEAICGLRSVTKGSIWLDGVDITDWSPGDRQVGYVPQDQVLFPTFTVGEHLAFALQLRNRTKAEIAKRTHDLANLLGISPLIDRSIDGLSGGERQRVALGRALSFRPSILLLDEPLSALDDATRSEMSDLLQHVKSTTGVTTLHVTHNREETAALADRHFTLADGTLRCVSASS
ncbi:ABC transporter ATP-binding protein [Novipirellula maiorica]|uniref:ABC transporter ATP-binding protein n=1 Tax=Novipirellula maiorica TaxID=1265734 RepID=UPI00034A3E89|nr:ABC transporter ATP-binding protein [Rhodopirellula maiorica]